eukprot:1156674-Pelagomonas_calceolata.AAC.9
MPEQHSYLDVKLGLAEPNCEHGATRGSTSLYSTSEPAQQGSRELRGSCAPTVTEKARANLENYEFYKNKILEK